MVVETMIVQDREGGVILVRIELAESGPHLSAPSLTVTQSDLRYMYEATSNLSRQALKIILGSLVLRLMFKCSRLNKAREIEP